MKILNKVTLLAADTSRSQAYTQAMINAGIIPENVLIYGLGKGNKRGKLLSPPPFQKINNLFVPNLLEPLNKTVNDLGSNIKTLKAETIKSKEILRVLSSIDSTFIIYSGFGGEIVPKTLCNNFKFIHIHSGWLPNFSGSTTLYYSLLFNGKCAASAIILNEEIDSGEIINRRRYKAPPPGIDIDHVYDGAIRADLLIRIMKFYAKYGVFPKKKKQNLKKRVVHYKIHPLLKNIIISKVNSKGFL